MKQTGQMSRAFLPAAPDIARRQTFPIFAATMAYGAFAH